MNATRFRPLVTASFLLVALATGTDAQRVAPRLMVQEAERGWIGISFQVIRDQRGHPIDIVVTEVSDGSPAAEAGVRRGDRLLAANDLDRPEELELLAERLRLSPGDRVVLEIQRDGDRRRLQLHAAGLPSGYEVGTRLELTLQSDSMVDSWVRAMDSLRIELVADEGRRIRVRQGTGQEGPRVTVSSGTGEAVIAGGSGLGRPGPFEFFVYRGEAYDSLRLEMAALSRATADLEIRIEARERELRGRVGRDDQRLGQDRESRALRTALEQATGRSAEIRSAIAEASRATAGLEEPVPIPGVGSTVGRPSGVAPLAEYRPLTPYLLGRNRVAGAEVIDLKPELAQYFQVDGGVLVVDVAPGTPASIAGIVPGDVITRIDQVGVRTVEDFRFGVSMDGETLPISLVRQGTSLQVLLRR